MWKNRKTLTFRKSWKCLALNDFNASLDRCPTHWTAFDGCMAVEATAQVTTWQEYYLTLKFQNRHLLDGHFVMKLN